MSASLLQVKAQELIRIAQSLGWTLLQSNITGTEATVQLRISASAPPSPPSPMPQPGAHPS